ncbi:hypothetical protein CURTO8I2_70260 [Curtobacterium sp. 8I-2]|nr:hypothetical protein CURTO8I2_70260 [Curtobacterium sp. 8I-2]
MARRRGDRARGGRGAPPVRTRRPPGGRHVGLGCARAGDGAARPGGLRPLVRRRTRGPARLRGAPRCGPVAVPLLDARPGAARRARSRCQPRAVRPALQARPAGGGRCDRGGRQRREVRLRGAVGDRSLRGAVRAVACGRARPVGERWALDRADRNGAGRVTARSRGRVACTA